MKQSDPLTFLRSPQFPIFMIVFVDVLGLGITLPVLPLFAQNQLGAAAWQITTLTSVYFLAQFIASPWLGRLSDRVGRRPVLILSQGGTLAALLLTGLAPGMIFLYLARAVDGLTGGNITVAQAYLSDITEARNRARGLGLVHAAFGMGFVFGPAFGGLVASYFGPRLPFFVAAGVSLLTITLSTFLLPESLPPERRKQEAELARGRAPVAAGSNPGLAPDSSNRGLAPDGSNRGLALLRLPAVSRLLLIGFTAQFGFFCFQTIYVLWAERLLFPGYPEASVSRAIGLILAAVGMFGVATQLWLVGPAVRRFGEKKLVVGGNLARAAAFSAMALSPTLAAVAGAVPFLAIGGGVAMPALIALLTYAAPPGERGRVIGLYQSAAALGSVLGPILSGFLFQQVHPDASMIAAAALTGVAVLVGLNFLRLRLATHPAPAAPINPA